MRPGECVHGVALSAPCEACPPWETIPAELSAAIRVAVDEGALYAYVVRERELEGWYGPRVKAISEAEQVLRRYAAPAAPTPAPKPLTYGEAMELLPAGERGRIVDAIRRGAE